MSHVHRQHGIWKAPVQQEASGEGRAALSVERAWQSWRGELGELPRQASSCGGTAGSQECLSTEITDFGAYFGRGRVRYLMWLNQRAIQEQWLAAFQQEDCKEPTSRVSNKNRK